MKVKKVLLAILAILIVLALGFALFKIGESKKRNPNKIQVVVSNFASYDFLRAVIGDNENVELVFLLGPGKDAHSYEPTAQDIVTIQNADLFVYVGGEMEQWTDKVLDSIDTKDMKIVCIADAVDTIDEQEIDGAEEEHEHEEGAFDEHIWTSPSNAIKMVNRLEKAMEEIDNNNAQKYRENANKYIAQIRDVDKQIQNIVDNKVRDRLIFADKMPMQYFIEYYDYK